MYKISKQGKADSIGSKLSVLTKQGQYKVISSGGGGGAVWGAITGTVTAQTDLVTYVTGLPVSTFTNDAGYITSTGITPSALTRTNDINITLTLTGTPSTALLQSVGLTLGWTGTLADIRIASASTWNAKQDPITLTTIGTSGVATFSSGTLNIPNYAVTGGTVTNVSGTTNRITVATGTTTPVIDISASYVGQSSITTLGTIATGTWQGTAIADTYISSAATWNAKQNSISLTTTGSGAATFVSNILNIPTPSIPTVTPSALTKTDDTNVTLTLGGSPSTALLAASSLALGWTGTLADGRIASASTWNAKQSALVSGTNIKTVNSSSLLGSGNLAVGDALVANPLSQFAATTSLQLAGVISDETGSGLLVFNNSPTLITASIGSSTASTQTPGDNSTKVATTAYVDNAVLGQNFKEAVKYASIAALPSIVYTNGSSGVGATLTGVALAAISLDSSSPAVNDRVLIKNQSSSFQNGIYTVTATGSGIAVFVLTRAGDSDQSAEWKTGDSVFVTAGNTLSTTTWAYTGVDNPTIGTDTVTFAQTAGQGSFTAGNGITITGTSIAVDTSIVVDKTTVQTLTNKTLTSPTLVTPILGTPTSGNLANCTFPTLNQSTTGSAATLTTPRNIQGISFNGSANIDVINGTGFVKATGTTLSYDNSTYHKGGVLALTSDFNTSSTTAVSTNLTFAIGANETWTVTFTGLCSKATSSTGLKFAIGAPTGCVVSGFVDSRSNVITTNQTYVVNAINTLGTALGTAIALVIPFTIEISLVNSTTAGNITLQLATVTSNIATVYAGSKMTYFKSTLV